MLHKKDACYLFSIIVLLLMINGNCYAQTKIKEGQGRRPKVGLALSGGGAKGMAHIGLLRLIDSLGIKIDYISGTSAGGIFGGLYAMGYSPDTLKKIALGINWRRVLSNKVPLNQINIEEKQEYGNYMIEFPVLGVMPRLPGALIDGQYISEVLNTLTFSAKHITDFNKLPIPITITSSDIVNGGLILQNKGSLPLAIRATLAIPAAFAPVYIDGRLLVDGGLDRNFPVQEVKDMGAEVVIGGYTGFRLFTEKEIENPMKLIYQTHAFRSVDDSKKQQQMTDVFVDFTQALLNYSTADFFQNKEILEIGEKQARKYLPELIRIAEEQKKYPLEKNNFDLKDPHLPVTKITYQNDKGQPLDVPVLEQFAASRLGLHSGEELKVEAVKEGIRDIYGTQFFDKVFYTFENKGDSALTMNVRLKQGKPGMFKAAVHYDTEQSAGLILNYTYRNVLFSKSRILATVDLSERFKARIDYYKFFSETNRFWLKMNFNYQALQNHSVLYKIISDENYFNNTMATEISLGYSLGRSSFVSIGLSKENEVVKRGPNIFKRIFDEGVDVRTLYKHNNEAFTFLFKQNNLDNIYFPRSGNALALQVKYMVNNSLRTIAPDPNDDKGQAVYQYLNPSQGLPGNILKFSVNENFVKKISSKLSLNSSVFWGFSYSAKHGIDSAYTYENAKFAIGGIEARQELGQSNFIGLKSGEFAIANVTSFGLALQYNLSWNFFLAPHINIGWQNKAFNPFNMSSKDYLLGYGAKLGYMSFLGPVNFAVARTNGFERNPWRIYLSLGFKF
ncbi:patatin [Pedobacter sp. KBW06]|uniref:patatin-like phospholipase family protein n=1 Tax=Pedobacter sp. KBW06 TaxID=2153359 RepID=UPI000F5B6DFA|nr:patatin-like phospholipase family protein [Pedobacter sp. KBW06]RQO75613.1 patatin [Pedobacter sp. KBW06]